MDNLLKQLEELNVIQHYLLPGESLTLVLPPEEREEWENLIQIFAESPESVSDQVPSSDCRFQIRVENAPVRIEIEFPREYPSRDSADVYVRGDDIDRSEQEELQQIIKDKEEELKGLDIEYPVYNLLSTTLLPILHKKAKSLRTHTSPGIGTAPQNGTNTEPIYHALFTSHHLISPTKRRNLQKWATELSLYGFAKAGYPGCIYCEGSQSDVEEFASNVRAMRWLALRLRFIEPLDAQYGSLSAASGSHYTDRRWLEFEKVGEVVEFMRDIGRDNFVTEMGLGAPSADTE